MKIYMVIKEIYFDNELQTDVQLFSSLNDAQKAVQRHYNAIQALTGIHANTPGKQQYCRMNEVRAGIMDGPNWFSWRIKEQDVAATAVKVAVEVSDERVLNVYVNSPVNAVFYDMDDEQTYTENAAALEWIGESPEWEQVW